MANSFEHGNDSSNSTAGEDFFFNNCEIFYISCWNRCKTKLIQTLTSFSNLKSAEDETKRGIPETS